MPSLLLFIHRWWCPERVWLVWSKAAFYSSSTHLHSPLLSALFSLLSCFQPVSLSKMLCPCFPHLSVSGAGWRSPHSEARSLPAPPDAALLSHCWGLPGRQLVPSAVQSSLRYLAQSLLSCAWGWIWGEQRGGNTSPHCVPLRKKHNLLWCQCIKLVIA